MRLRNRLTANRCRTIMVELLFTAEVQPMSQTFRSAAIIATCVLALGIAVTAHAQSGSSTTTSGQTASTSQSTTIGREPETRPATTTFLGDTGLWFVPTAEILPDGR